MNPEQYEEWRARWTRHHPDKIPPTYEQVNELLRMFSISTDEVLRTVVD